MLYTPNQANAFRMVHTPATYAAAAVDGTYISLVEHRSVTFVAGNGELDGNIVLAIVEATDSSGTSAQVLAGKAGTFTNGTDETRVGLITVNDFDVTLGYPWVTVRVTPAATDSFFCIAVVSNPNKLPAQNTTALGVAFDDV